MFNSLIYGSESLSLKKEMREIEVPAGGKLIKKKRPRWTIDIDYEKYPELKAFKIGHEEQQSETFLPNFMYDPKSKNVYVDIAGLNDTSGEFIEMINWMICKHVFSIVDSFKLIVPVTIYQIDDTRG